MTKYSKLIAAVVGILAIILGPEFLNISDGTTIFGLNAEMIVQGIMGILTAFGVWGVKNT